MNATLEALAVAVILSGIVLFNVADTALAGTALVAVGAYALVVPTFIEPLDPATR